MIRVQFRLLPVLTTMLDFYAKPRTIERFQDYLKLLQGSSPNELLLPLGGFNPMGKEHVLAKLRELQALNVEEIMLETIQQWNAEHAKPAEETVFQVAFNLSDDLKGGWTNRFATDYDMKFNCAGLVNKKFCTPIFWSSEEFSLQLIRERTRASLVRTHYFLNQRKPKTLSDHVAQERYVNCFAPKTDAAPLTDFDAMHLYYQEHAHSESYAIIFNFFYGDEACKALGFPHYGIHETMAGFRFCNATKEEALKL